MRVPLEATERTQTDPQTLPIRHSLSSRTRTSPSTRGSYGIQAKCACGGGCRRCQLADPQVREPREHFEIEADRVANQIAGQPNVGAINPVHDSPPNHSHSGRALTPSVRSLVEPRLGTNLSDVRIHDDISTAATAHALEASAFTVGNHIYFAAGRYTPKNTAGLHLLAHELAHVVQQREAGDGAWIQRTPDKKIFGPRTGAPSNWSGRVRAATTSAEKAALVHEATGVQVRDITDAAEGDDRVDKRHLIAYDATTPVINYDDNLNEKKSRSGRDLGRVAGHIVNDEASYVILGPKSLDAGDFFETRRVLSHEFDHIRQQRAGSRLRGNESEVDAWTTSFVRDFHRSYTLAKIPSTCFVDHVQTWTPLLEYYVRHDVGHAVKEDAVRRISDYYRTVVEPHPAHRKVFRFWIHRTLRKVRPVRFTELARDLNNALNLRVDPAEDLGTTRQFPCGNLESLRYERSTVDYPTGSSLSEAPRGRGGLTLEMVGGGSLDSAARSAALGIGLRYSLRSSQAIIWNPVLGAQLLYLPPGGDRGTHLGAAILEIGLRLQQPVEGFYFDARGGGFAGFRTGGPSDDEDVYPQVGITGSLGAGYRIGDFEFGLAVRDMLGLAEPSRNHVILFGVGAYTF